MQDTYFQHLQLLDTLLHKLLYPPLIGVILMLSEPVARSSLGVLAEIVGGELIALPEERTVLLSRTPLATAETMRWSVS
jgi:hypothetical protein